MPKRKTKKKTKRKKYICCVGVGCPEWKHCIHVLGDGDKWRPKRKETLKRMEKCEKLRLKLLRKCRKKRKYKTCSNMSWRTYKKCMKKERKKSQKRRTRKKRGGAVEKISPPVNMESLQHILEDGGVPANNINNWGTSGSNTKSLSKLFNEVKKGETKLVKINGKIKRIVETVDVKIYDNPQKTYLLYEEGHYNDNNGEPGLKTKNRGNAGVREKMNEGENPRDAVKRGIAEELGTRYSKNIRFFKGKPTIDIDKVDVIEEDSNSYPGLPARYKWYRDEVIIPDLTTDTIYPDRGVGKKDFFTKEINDDGSFKRWIKWEWRRT